MRLRSATRFLTLAAAVRSTPAFVPTSGSRLARAVGTTTTQRFMSSGEQVQLKNIGWEEMDSIVDNYEELGREESGMIVLDVRNEDEVAMTGKVSPNTITLPLPAIMQYDLFAMDDDEFEDLCGFKKPSPDETIVLTCAAGIRSVHAANFAARNGYSNLVNYMGGANEWFTR